MILSSIPSATFRREAVQSTTRTFPEPPERLPVSPDEWCHILAGSQWGEWLLRLMLGTSAPVHEIPGYAIKFAAECVLTVWSNESSLGANRVNKGSADMDRQAVGLIQIYPAIRGEEAWILGDPLANQTLDSMGVKSAADDLRRSLGSYSLAKLRNAILLDGTVSQIDLILSMYVTAGDAIRAWRFLRGGNPNVRDPLSGLIPGNTPVAVRAGVLADAINLFGSVQGMVRNREANTRNWVDYTARMAKSYKSMGRAFSECFPITQ